MVHREPRKINRELSGKNAKEVDDSVIFFSALAKIIMYL